MSDRTSFWLTMTALSMIWGSSFILIDIGLDYFSPYQVGCLRILIAALAFAPIFFMRIKRVPWKRWPYFVIVALCGSGLPAFLFPMAQVNLDSAVAGILNSVTPIFTLILGGIFFGKTITPLNVLGTILGFIGVCLLLLSGYNGSEGVAILSALLALLATMCYATSVNTVSAHLADVSPVTLSGASFVLAGPIALAYLLLDPPLPVEGQSEFWQSMGAVTVLSLLGTFLSTIIFFRMVQKTSALTGSMVAYFIPIVALGWGFVAGENITVWHIVGMISIVLGVYIARKKKRSLLVSKSWR